MALSWTTKQHDTRPTRTLYITETNPSDPSEQRAVDLTNAVSARLLGKISGTATSFVSVVTISSPRTLGQVVYVPVAGDTAIAGDYQGEIEVTWQDGGVETYPSDTYFTIVVLPDLG